MTTDANPDKDEGRDDSRFSFRDDVIRDAEIARVVMDERYTLDQTNWSGRSQGFALRMRSVVAGPLELTIMRWHTATADTSWTMTSAPEGSASDPRFRALTVLSGGCEVQDSFGEKGVTVGDVTRYDAEGPRWSRWGHVEAAELWLPMSLVREVADSLDPLSPERFRFLGTTPIDTARAQRWSVLTALVRYQTLGANPVLANPMIQVATARHVAATALEVFPNSALLQDYRRGPGATSPAAMRRAVAFMDAYASLPISMADVAQSAGISVRSLRAAFHHQRATTPSAYLRQVRLDGAHRDLQVADPARGETVATIARRWGFADLRRFAVRYHTAYGLDPEHTLRS